MIVPIQNSDLAQIFEEVADLCRFEGEIRKIEAAGPTAYYCPACQPKAR